MEIAVKDVVNDRGSAFTTLQAWEFRDPADVAERRELQANAAQSRRRQELEQALAKQAERQRIRNLVFRKGAS